MQFNVKPVELPADAADIPLGLAMMALSYGCVGVEIESGELTAEELGRSHLFLGPDSTYRLGILPTSSDEATVECDDDDWKQRLRQHELHTRTVESQNAALWDKARPKWQYNLGRAEATLACALERLLAAFNISENRGGVDPQGTPSELGDSLNNFREHEKILLSIRWRLENGQNYLDLPTAPSRKTAYVRILRGPHQDRVTPAGFPCFHDRSADHDSPTLETEQWLRKHGRDGRLSFSGVPSSDLIVGARSALGVGRRRQPIPASCFTEKVGFDMEADRIYPLSVDSDDYQAFVDELSSALNRQPEINPSDFNAWSNVTVDAEQFRVQLRRREAGRVAGTRTISREEKIMVQKLVDLIRTMGNPTQDDAADYIGRNKKGSVFKRVCAQACEQTGYVFTKGPRRKKRSG